MASKLHKATIPAGLTIYPTDSVSVVGGNLVVVRGGLEVYRINLNPLSQPLSVPFQFGQPDNVKYIFWEKKMPGINVALQGVVENQVTGVVRFQFSDGTENEYSNWLDVSDIADQIDADTTWLKKLIVARSFRKSPGGENKTTQVGAQASANLVAAEPITFTEVQ